MAPGFYEYFVEEQSRNLEELITPMLNDNPLSPFRTMFRYHRENVKQKEGCTRSSSRHRGSIYFVSHRVDPTREDE